MTRWLALCMFFLAVPALARVYPLPPAGEDLIGEEQMVLATDEDTLVDIARRHGLGFDEIVGANAAVDTWLPREGTPVLLPLRFILPEGPRQGIVINVAEMRLFYYPRPARGEVPVVETYPISIGRSDWNTPLISTRVVRKAKDPSWYPPASLRRERALEGDPPLPSVVPPGPDNPLGKHALYLGAGAYLIHGTNEAKAFGIGMQVTHGCMRMYPEDIERLFAEVPVGTPVRIINQPIKLGWHQNMLYLEIHPWLEGTPKAHMEDKALLPGLIEQAAAVHPGYPVNWRAVEFADIERNGIPIPIGPALEQAARQGDGASPAPASTGTN